MTSFLGTTSGTAGVGIPQAADDIRLWPTWGLPSGRCLFVPGSAWLPAHYENEWWPGGSRLDASGGEWLVPVWYNRPEFTSGAVSRYAFVGVTRDGYGSPLGGVTVKLFKTVGGGSPDLKDVLLYETVSDVAGNFTVYTSYYPDTHYLVTYKAGVPDVQGTTVNTLIGA